MVMEGTMKNKRPREEEAEEDLCNKKEKNARLEEVGINDFYSNLSTFSSEKSMVLNDQWSFPDDGPVSDIRGIAIRKQSYIKDYFNSVEEVGLEDKRTNQDNGGDLFEELWRPQSPLCGAAESLFGGFDYFMGANLGDERDSGFRIWEESEEQDDEKNVNRNCHKSSDGIGLLYENDVADWIWGTPLNQPLCSESLEFKVSTPSL
ncbi:uncharacterized protein LOC131061899 [Cryptomeria japonica]|uniref:uncharacterized protein LOC131061899 n=1 Tax=Cryptomeria japonica TaxID=3369 RepID=UPI0027DA5449|nr:uncharacterized protein LOC131061899 [Cryptomeria japonica]